MYLILSSSASSAIAYSDSCRLRLDDILNGGEILYGRGRLHELLLHVLNKSLFL